MTKIPGSSTVVTGGGAGDFVTPLAGWPPGQRLNRFHRTKFLTCRYKGAGDAGLSYNAHADFDRRGIVSTVFRARGNGVTVGVAE
jgi:hypothetical protein